MFIEGLNYVPGTVLNTLCALTRLILSTTPGSSYSHHLHCVEWKGTLPKHRQQVAELRLFLKVQELLDSKSLLLITA